MRSKTGFLLLLLLALVAAACGSSTEEAADTTTTTEAPAETTSTTTEAPTTTTTTTTEAPTTTTAPAEIDPDDPTVVAYCEAGDSVNARIDAADFNDPIAVEDAFGYQYDTMSVVEAPAAIEADVATMVDMSNSAYLILEDYDFNFFAASEEIFALTESPEFVAASETLDAFGEAYCPQVEDADPLENELGLTEADVLDLLQDPVERLSVAEGMREGTTLTSEEAMCVLDETDPNVIAALFSVGVGEAEPDLEIMGGFFEGLAACEIPIDAFG